MKKHNNSKNCPFCGGPDYTTNEACIECGGLEVTCPLCDKLILTVSENGVSQNLCNCVVGVYSYANSEFVVDNQLFHAWRERYLKNKNDKDSNLLTDPTEAMSLADKNTWIKYRIVGELGSFGHNQGDPDIYFFVSPEDLSKFK